MAPGPGDCHTGHMISGATRFETFGAQHQVVLVVFVVGCLAAGLAGRALLRRGEDAVTRWCRVSAVVFGVFVVTVQVTDWVMEGFDVHKSLPFQICDLVQIVLVVALWTRSRTWTALGYYWGLTLSVQGVLTPDLRTPFPEARFLLFWALHLAVVWMAVFLGIGLRQGPTWREYRRVVALTFGWVAVMMVINTLVDSNYGFLNAKPRAGSILDSFGPWPMYVVAEIVIVAILWALITLPWVVGRRHSTLPDRQKSAV